MVENESRELRMGIFTLHRYFIWANAMRTHFDEVLTQPRNDGWEIRTRMYMSYWYAGLYVVIEGWRKLHLTDPAIDGLLDSPNVALLRRYRHGVYHFQKDYDDPRFIEFISEGEDVVSWVRSLNEQFGRYFFDWLDQQKEDENSSK